MSIFKHIPNTITSMNLICGIVGVIFAFKSRFDLAFIFMLCGAACDFCDGLAARALNAYSDIGKELDSLADMVSFGVLPSIMLYKMMCICTFSENILCYIPLCVAVFSALRLAKFNIDERQHLSFIGLPTPACAMICGSLCYFISHDQNNFLAAWSAGFVFIPVLSIILSLLLVSEIPMFSMKFSKNTESVVLKKRIFFALNVVIVILMVFVLGLNWSLAVLLSFIVYILMNSVFTIFKI